MVLLVTEKIECPLFVLAANTLPPVTLFLLFQKMLRRAALTLAARSRPLLEKHDYHVLRPDYTQGKERMEYDQPARWNKFQEKLQWLSDDDKEEYVEEPYIGVDHLYEAHFGSKENPVIVEQMGLHGNDIMVGCLGMFPFVTYRKGEVI